MFAISGRVGTLARTILLTSSYWRRSTEDAEEGEEEEVHKDFCKPDWSHSINVR